MFTFFATDLESESVVLSVEESRHCVRTLRKVAGDTIALTDGQGRCAVGEIAVADASACMVNVLERHRTPPRRCRLHLAVAPTKNSDRMEWLVEKAVEIGCEKISFIICEHSERRKQDLSRLQRIAVSALKQSQTSVLPEMQVVGFKDFIEKNETQELARYIAWCDDENTAQLVDEPLPEGEVLLLIGPEGDFSKEEIDICKSKKYKEIKLGSRRLRTETAALYGCFVVSASNEKM
ncbi:MAG: 16S rRNA (uracil(1498)-N(3))-methyltransferase [Bacteroidales bacterium]|nr:16S rRNA (uracil(1498)-N(3))-methyltransferase [Bacteroidales bacterium]